MTQRNARDEGRDGGGNGNWRSGRDRNDESAGSYARSRGGPPGRSRAESSGQGHAGYGDYGTREYEPRPDDESETRFRSAGRGGGGWGGGEQPSATRPRDFRDYGRGDYRGNVGPGGFGYAEANYGPTRYGEQYGRSGREPESEAWREPGAPPSHRGRGPRTYRRSDERIRENLCERLTDDPYVDASEVSIDVKDGVVTLTGSVPERRMKHRIEDIAADLARDCEIRNEIRVGRL